MSNNTLSKEGAEKLKEELEDLKLNKRKEVSERIKIAREFGDLKENAEYHEAKDEQGFIEGRILELENILKTAKIVMKKKSSDIVNIGSRIIIEKEGENMEFTISSQAKVILTILMIIISFFILYPNLLTNIVSNISLI